MIRPLFSARVDDSDLQLKRGTVAEADNGFTSLVSATELMWWPPDQQQELNNLARGTNWDASLAVTALANNGKSLAALDAALKTPSFQVTEFSNTDLLDYLSSWKSLGQLAALRANATFRAGHEQEAFQQALDIVRLGGRMENSDGAILHHLVGMAVKGIGLSLMRQWSAETKLDPQKLAEMSHKLHEIGDSRTALTNSLKAEYRFQMQVLADIRAARTQAPGGLPLASCRILPIHDQNRTHANFANHSRALIAAISQPYSKANIPVLQRKHPLTLLLGGNFIGDILYAMTVPATDKIIEMKSFEAVNVEATCTLLALRACQLKQGRLPTKLDELIPEFLPSLPVDDFDGQSLRYNPSNKLLYSVGLDGRDDDGTEMEGRKHAPDYAFAIPF